MRKILKALAMLLAILVVIEILLMTVFTQKYQEYKTETALSSCRQGTADCYEIAAKTTKIRKN